MALYPTAEMMSAFTGYEAPGFSAPMVRDARGATLIVGLMARAVAGWSPVTMITLIPASRHLCSASGTSGRGGSSRLRRQPQRQPQRAHHNACPRKS